MILCGALVLASCGRVGFERTGIDAGSADAAPSDAGVVDGGPSDAGPSDAGVVDGGPSDAGPSDAGAPPDYCLRVPAMGSTPTIDGVPEPGLPWMEIVPVDWTGSEPLPAGRRAMLRVGWRPDGVYFAIDVEDPTREPALAGEPPYCGDAVEIYLDADAAYPSSPDYDVPGTRQCVMVAPSDDVTPVARGALYRTGGSEESWTGAFIAVPRSGGYVAEAFVTASELGLPSLSLVGGQRIGLDIAINLVAAAPPEAACSLRYGQYFLRTSAMGGGCVGYPFCDVRAFCTATLEP